jgi:acetyltransferase-like isoleucine patch superfamily enzyme
MKGVEIGRIHPTALVSDKATIGGNVTIAANAIVYDDVEIGDNSVIESYCEIGYSNGREKRGLIIGENAKIRSHSILYQGSVIGKNLVTGHHAIIRENMQIGDDFQAGAGTIVMGEAVIGDYVKTGSMVEIGQLSRIGNYVWIYLHSILINDLYPPSEDIVGPEISDYAIIGASCVVFPGVKVGRNSIVSAGCVLKNDLPDNQIAVGNPQKIIGSISEIKILGTGEDAYPWRYRFHRGYPQEVISGWMKEKLNEP